MSAQDTGLAGWPLCLPENRRRPGVDGRGELLRLDASRAPSSWMSSYNAADRDVGKKPMSKRAVPLVTHRQNTTIVKLMREKGYCDKGLP